MIIDKIKGNCRAFALLLIIIPINIIYFLFFIPYMRERYSGELFMLFTYVPSILGYLIYLLNIKERNKKQLLYLAYSCAAMIASTLFINNVNEGKIFFTNIDIDVNTFVLFIFLFIVFSIVKTVYGVRLLAMKDNYSYMIIPCILIVSIIAIFLITNVEIKTSEIYSNSEKVDEDIPTLSDFKNELINRGLYNRIDNKIYGIKFGNEKAIELSFKENGNDKYPLYLCAWQASDSGNYAKWLIYYINGKIYATPGKYYSEKYYLSSSVNSEEKTLISYPKIIISESNEITTYNPKYNFYKSGDNIIFSKFSYYSGSKDEKNVFIDIPTIPDYDAKAISVNVPIKTFDTINNNSLEEYSLKYIDKN